MKGFEQQRAHELAKLAAKWAEELAEGETFSMQTDTDQAGRRITITFRLTNRAGNGNTLDVEKEGEPPAGDSLPW